MPHVTMQESSAPGGLTKTGAFFQKEICPFCQNAASGLGSLGCDSKQSSRDSSRSTPSQGSRELVPSPSKPSRKNDIKPPPSTTIRINFGEFYPDGGWGWVICGAAALVYILCHGFHFSYGVLYLLIMEEFKAELADSVWLGSLGLSVTLLLSPVITTICRRKSPRLYAVIGGLISSLGCLFLAFSTQVEQLFISHGVVFSLGTGITLSTANMMIGRYFRERRELAEVIVLSGTGLGAALMSVIFSRLYRSLQWMHGLQCVAGLLVLTIVAGALYRPASLYHPRRKVILHIKSQKRTRRDRNADKPPYFDFSALRMRSVQLLMLITSLIALGIHVPVILLTHTAMDKTMSNSDTASHNRQVNYDFANNDALILLNVYMGMGLVIGCCTHGYIVIRNNSKCIISRRYLCQSAALTCGVLCLLLTMAQDYNAFALFAWGFGICYGGYYYSLKMYTFELVRTKVMERAWGFICAAQCLSILVGTPIAVYLNDIRSLPSPVSGKGFVFAGVSTIIGGLLFFAMSFAEKHHSNADVLQKHTCTCDQQIAEAAALLDMTADGIMSKPLNNAQFIISPIQLRKPPAVRDTNNGQLQSFLSHKDNQKQNVLSKIAEEREMGHCDWKDVPHVSPLDKVADYIMGRKDLTDNEYSNCSIDPPQMTSDTSSSSGDKTNRQEKHLPDRKEKVVKIELFDPPSQEKESTATVSYDSDLYINLCEAQV